MTDGGPLPERADRLALSELVSHVLDKGVVITGEVTIAVADIELIRVGLSLWLSAVETLERGAVNRGDEDGDLPVLLPSTRR